MDYFDEIAAGIRPAPPQSPANLCASAELLAKAELALSYDLAKRVPDMERGFSISTSYGEIHFGPGLAADAIASTVRCILEKWLKNAVIARTHAEKRVSSTSPQIKGTVELTHAHIEEQFSALMEGRQK